MAVRGTHQFELHQAEERLVESEIVVLSHFLY
jgi:hypothetical protein